MTSSRRDPGAARGNQTYQPSSGPCATCSHSEFSHRFRPTKGRGKCTVISYDSGPCGCKTYR